VTPFPWSDVVVIAGLVLVNAIFAMSELAIVSARTSRLRLAAKHGSTSARVAIQLAADPGKFLSTVQFGITLIAIVAGAYSGASLGRPLGERLLLLGVPERYADQAGFVLAIALTTYFSLVVGELVPKQLALRKAVPIALAMARPMAILAKVAAPFVWLLDSSSALLMRLIGIRHRGEHGLTAEELQMIFAEATRTGAIEEEERAILSGVMKLSSRPVRELMTPRTEIDWLEISADEREIRKVIEETPHSLLPVAEGSVDKVVGVVKLREVLALLLEEQQVDLSLLLRKAEVIPDQVDAMDALRLLQHSEIAMAMVHDEYGHLEGIVTPADLLDAIAGSFASHQDEGEGPLVTERADGSLLVSGALPVDQLAERLGIDLPEPREFATVAGYALWVLKALPAEGEAFTEQGWRFEVVDMDGRRIDKLLVSEVERKKGQKRPPADAH
jgi:putative hemolysin